MPTRTIDEAERKLTPQQSESIDKILSTHTSPDMRWSEITQLLSSWNAAPEIYRSIWKQAIDTPNQLTPLWWPDEKRIADSNVARWYRELNLDNYRAFHRWSVENREQFWEQATQRLNIAMDSRGDRIASSREDIANLIWFPDAQLNIVNSCFQASDHEVAIRSQQPGQPIKDTSYGELKAETFRCANSLIQAGFQPGDRIAVSLPMTRLSISIYLGIVAAGCSVVSIADSFAAPEIRTRLEIADAKAVFTYDVIQRAGKSLPLYERVAEATSVPIIVLSEDDDLAIQLRDQDHSWNNFVVDDDQFVPANASANDCINVLFSSGTTGDPKAIVWNHLTPVRCAVDGFVHHDIQPGDVAVWPTNLGWMMGPWLIFASLINRATIGLYEDVPMTEEFGKFIQDAHVTMLGVVPTIVKSWRKNQTMEKFDWSNIKCFSSTGETSHPDDMFYLSSLAEMRPIIEYCGGTEIGGGYVTSTIVQPNVASAFTTPSIALDFVLLNADHEVDHEGEVFLLPPSIGLSNTLLNRDHYETYFAGTPRIDGATCLRRHGDHFRKVDGYFVAGGRTDDTMNLGGIKISSAELERVLNQIDGVRETAAVAMCDDHGPDRLVVFAVLDSYNPVDDLQGKMNIALKSELNPLFKVSQVELVDSLPRTASNKVMRRKLREKLTG